MNIDIHQTSHVEPGASIGDNVEIGPFSIIHKNVILHVVARCLIVNLSKNL